MFGISVSALVPKRTAISGPGSIEGELMNTLPDEIKEALYRFLDGRTPLAEFERWVYATPALEDLFDRDSYIDLLAADFRDQSSVAQVESQLEARIDHGDYVTWQVRSELAVILRRDEADLPNALDRIYYWYCDGLYFLDNLALGFALGVRVPLSTYPADGWEDLSATDQATILASLYPAIAGEAARVLRWLDEGTIVITGGQLTYDCRLEFLDYREPAERRPTAYTVHNYNEDAV
jgi:hypothetical protein